MEYEFNLKKFLEIKGVDMEFRWWYVTSKLCGFPECCIISFALGKKVT